MNSYVIARYQKNNEKPGFVVVDINGRIANNMVHKVEQEAIKHCAELNARWREWIENSAP